MSKFQMITLETQEHLTEALDISADFVEKNTEIVGWVKRVASRPANFTKLTANMATFDDSAD